jgi:hypothetical protein
VEATASELEQRASTVAECATRLATWRTVLSRVLIGVFAILMPLALVGSWAHLTVLDTDTYVERVSALASDPDLQGAVADQLVAVLAERPRVTALLASGTLSHEQIERATRFVVASDAFASLWTAANHVAHPQLVALMTGNAGIVTAGGRMIVNMNAVARAVENRLNVEGYEVDLGLSITNRPVTVTLFQSDELEMAQQWVRLLNRVAVVLPFAAVAAAVTAFLVAEHRGRAVQASGIALAIGMGTLLGLLLIGRWWYLDSLGSGVPLYAAAAVFDILAKTLWQAALVLLVVGSMVALLFGWLARGEEQTA